MTRGVPSCQVGGTLFGSECERDMVFVFELGTGEGAGVPRPRAWAGRAKVSDVVRASRMGSLRGRVGRESSACEGGPLETRLSPYEGLGSRAP